METETKTNSNYAVPIGIILAGIIVAGTIYFGGNRPVAVPEKKPSLIEQVNVTDSPFIGDPEAPVVMIEWYDYKCPACKYADRQIIFPLVADYVKNGKLKIVFKDFAFLGPDSQTLALTGRAVWEAYPDKYYEWHKIIFENQGDERIIWGTKEKISELTKKVSGIDLAVIEELLAVNVDRYQSLIDADRSEGIGLGISSTPSFLIGEKIQVGAPLYANIRAMIDILLE